MDLKPGSRWKSAVCEAEVVVVRPPKALGLLACGGEPMAPFGAERPACLSPAPEFADGVLAGKRYADAETGLEVLCSKAGAGSLAFAGRPLEIKDAKKLPASD